MSPIAWPEAQRICDIPEVREALDKFAADAHEENMLAMVSAIMGHAVAQGRAAGLEEVRLGRRVSVDAGALKMVLNTLRRDAEEGRTARGGMADALWESCIREDATPSEAGKDDDKWYLQDTRSYVGNDVMWWAKDGKGYTTDVSKAHVYERDAAFRQAAMRGTDRAWPKAYIDGKTRPAVDMQYINHDEALSSLEVIGKGEKG